jgi:dihydrolipoamide dehydrogenase
VLLAIGRKTHLASLGVQSIDVEIDERGNPKNVNPKTGQVGDSNVYIIGDANGILPLMHVASDEGYNAGSVVCGDGNSDLVFQRVPMAITFTEPNICQVGENLPTLNAMQDKGELQFVTGRVNFSNQGRSRVMGVNMGQMHIYAHKDNGKILGASMIAPDGEYLTHLLALAIDNGLTAKKMLEMPFYHPTIVEALRTCLRDVERQLHIEFIPNEKLTP